MIKWLTIPDETKRNAYIQIAENTGMSPFAVEKDWWVVQTLSIVFDMDVAQHLVFKGGTSLSKAWKLIQRFSEDIDLAFDREFFGFKGELSKNQRYNLRKTAGRYVDTEIYSNLIDGFNAKGIKDLRIELEKGTDSDRDRVIFIYYPNLIGSPSQLEPKVKLELGCRSLLEPFTVQSFGSLIDEAFPERDFIQTPINIPTVNPERTFLEKIFLLHEELHRTAERRRVERLSRHLYDVVKLSFTEFADKALNDPELYRTIVDHRYHNTRVGGVDYNSLNPKSIDPIPSPEVMPYWERDYKVLMEEMIYEKDPPSFNEIIQTINALKTKINALTWDLKMTYPTFSAGKV